MAVSQGELGLPGRLGDAFITMENELTACVIWALVVGIAEPFSLY